MRFYRNDRLFELMHPSIGAVMGATVEKITAGSRALEVECESGRFSAAIAPKLSSLIAVTLREPLFQMANDRLNSLGIQNVDLRRGAALKEVQGLKPFDVIVIGNIIYNLADPETFLRSFDPYLKNSGTVIIHSFLFDSSPVSRFLARFASFRGLKIRQNFHLQGFKKILESAGFEITSEATFPGVVPLGFLTAKKKPSERKKFSRFHNSSRYRGIQ